ncbi:hypothetical protein [Nitrosomonas mobilis]|uniref:hypothetical protein n=1 Tax=Nitrosomonas mobilis TaxID=51642 RepID=UPI001FDF312F|nr:hypothetical protein [Nitrosomonas mobilis]
MRPLHGSVILKLTFRYPDLPRVYGAFLSFAPIRQHLVDFIPERITVVAVMEMAEFVHHDVVDDAWRSHHALPVKIEHAALAATNPAAAHFLDLDASHAYAHSGCIERHTPGKTLLALDESLSGSALPPARNDTPPAP